MSQHLKVLIVEDQPADAELLQYDMRRAGLEFTAQRVETQDTFEAALREFGPDLILSDFSMPSFDGLSALGLARAAAPGTPFIFVSGTIGEERAIEALRNGATDYVLKDRPKRIISAIDRPLDEAKTRAAAVDTREALEQSEKRFRSFMEQLPARVSIVDGEGRYVFVNESWARAAGRPAHDVLGRDHAEIAPPEDGIGIGSHRAVVTNRKAVNRIFRVGNGAAARWWCESCFPIADAEGKLMSGTIAIKVTEYQL